MNTGVLVALLFYVAMCLVVGFYAKQRGGSVIICTVGAFIFTPIIGAILASFGGRQQVVILEKKEK
ncbi:hypothetical protein ABXV18_26930 [Vibrio owensii]|uniref:hypothetical protein n=1 Tax=Vibrio owensii TaxID=696485 RepID=UPI0033912247